VIPIGPRLAVRRITGERTLASGIVLPLPDQRHSCVGTVIAAGGPHRVRGRRLPLEVGVGEDIVYSSRVDSFVLDDGATVDIVEENSVIGRL
jgi:co-chaperonin GroES (HSP10)